MEAENIDCMAVWEHVCGLMWTTEEQQKERDVLRLFAYWDGHREDVGSVQMRGDVEAITAPLVAAYLECCEQWDKESNNKLPRAHAFDFEFVPEVLDYMVLNDQEPLSFTTKQPFLDAAAQVWPRRNSFLVEIDTEIGYGGESLKSLLDAVLGQQDTVIEVVEVLDKATGLPAKNPLSYEVKADSELHLSVFNLENYPDHESARKDGAASDVQGSVFYGTTMQIGDLACLLSAFNQCYSGDNEFQIVVQNVDGIYIPLDKALVDGKSPWGA